MALAFCAAVPYRAWARLAWPILGLTVVALVLVVLPWTHAIAPEINGARRWLNVGIGLQPSEFAKIAVVVWTAALAVRKAPEFKSLSRGMMPFLVVWGVVLGLIFGPPARPLNGLPRRHARRPGGVLRRWADRPFRLSGAAGSARAPESALRWLPRRSPRRLLRSRLGSHGGGLPGPAVAGGPGLGRGLRRGDWRRAAEVRLPARSPQRLHLRHDRRGMGPSGCARPGACYGVLVLVGFRVAGRAPDLFGELLAVGLTSLIALQALFTWPWGWPSCRPPGCRFLWCRSGARTFWSRASPWGCSCP